MYTEYHWLASILSSDTSGDRFSDYPLLTSFDLDVISHHTPFRADISIEWYDMQHYCALECPLWGLAYRKPKFQFIQFGLPVNVDVSVNLGSVLRSSPSPSFCSLSVTGDHSGQSLSRTSSHLHSLIRAVLAYRFGRKSFAALL